MSIAEKIKNSILDAFNSLPKPKEGHIYLWRGTGGEKTETGKALSASWGTTKHSLPKGQKDHFGRWFGDRFEDTLWYIGDSSDPKMNETSRISFIEISIDEARRSYLANMDSSNPEQKTILSFSKNPNAEFFVPQTVANQKQTLVDFPCTDVDHLTLDECTALGREIDEIIGDTELRARLKMTATRCSANTSSASTTLIHTP